MRLIIPFILLVACYPILLPQSLPYSECTWFRTNECIPQGVCFDRYLKAEKDPALADLDKTHFENMVRAVVKRMNLAQNVNGFLKLKIIFSIDGSLCLYKLGTHQIELDSQKISLWTNLINSSGQVLPGRQKDLIVNCEGILYIAIVEGIMEFYRNFNFRFKDD